MTPLKSLLGFFSPKKKAERVQVQLSHGGNGFTIPFKNGNITIPDQPGGYVVSCGCGSGKTESIKSLIRQRWNKGILYCVDTKVECTKMYDWICDNLVGERLGGTKLKKEDILLLHGGADYEDMNAYRSNPEQLMKYRIILITHPRFMIDPVNLFLIYRTDTTSPGIQPFDGDFGGLMGRPDLRAYILFDETPLFFQPSFTIPRSVLGIFSDQTGDSYKVKSEADMEKAYKTFLSGTAQDPWKDSSALATLKRKSALSVIPKYYDHWMEKRRDDYPVYYYPSMLVVPGMQSHVIIYEGVGDALFTGSSCFKLLDLSIKYQGNIHFQEFPFQLDRKSVV